VQNGTCFAVAHLHPVFLGCLPRAYPVHLGCIWVFWPFIIGYLQKNGESAVGWAECNEAQQRKAMRQRYAL
jgi:hypothetical protein